MIKKASELSLEEKLLLLTGKDLWHINDLNDKLKQTLLADGPSGLRLATGEGEHFATAMPTLSTVANTWNTELALKDGVTIADECVEKNVQVLLAPGVNIKKTPLCGRNFEYFSEDPYLAGEMAKAFVTGVQSKGIGTSVKHFAANNREDERFWQSSEVDERTLREIYLPAFEKAVEAKPYTVMCAYNPVNGVYASENKPLLDDVLRKTFGFNGVIVSDWEAVHNRYKALKATLDLEMPFNKDSYANLKEAYDNGLISEAEIDASAQRILDLITKCDAATKKVEFTAQERHDTAVEIAKEGIVLLKNEGILPLTAKKIAAGGSAPVIGGSGSSKVNTAYAVKPLIELLREKLPQAQIRGFADGIYPAYYNTYNFFKSTYINAYGCDAVILTISEGDLSEAEGSDRRTIKLHPRAVERILKTAEINPKLIVVIYAGSAVDMCEWIDNVKAVVFAGYSGEGVTEALAALLTGEQSFSGKLAETFPRRIEDTPDYGNYADGFTEWYKEGIFVGYRHYDKFNTEPLFPFGYGLSYARFEYSDLKAKKLGETDYEISYKITNVSDFPAKEISQIYVKDVFSSVIRPEKELKGFSKDFIAAGETVAVTRKLNARSFAYYSTVKKDWFVENGSFEILVGASSRDIRLKTVIEINLPDSTQPSFLG